MGEQPAGTVTFLFTDIEGSTRRWQADPAAMEQALSRHDALLAEAVEGRGGRIFKHTGDGVCAVFASPADAVTAAVAAQRAVGAADFGAVGGLAVRMALHTGQSHEREGDYFGPTLNRVARLMGVAHGGQILATAATSALLADEPPPGVAFTDLGEHRLRDLATPERIHQVVAEGVRDSFPPLRSLDSFDHNLPRPRSSFVGREREVGEVVGRLVPGALVTLTGIGGAGKTRLAVAVGEAALASFPGGAFFVDASGIADPDLVAAELAKAVGIHRGGGMAGTATDPLGEAVALLADRTALVVLDNCEHLVEACADVADELLARCPDVALLATSREPLSLEGEQVWRVPSLSLPEGDDGDGGPSEAVRLFSERAEAVDPQFELTVHRAAVAEICRRLDGIPLAIELAAAQVAYLTPSEIAQRLDDRFQLLTGGRRRVQRQHTLEAALDWSHELLDPHEQVLLRRLGVFGGGFAMDDAEAVCASEPLTRVAGLLGSLVRKSLVAAEESEGQTRYRLLESVRLYALARLTESGEAPDVRSRHRDHYLAVVEQPSLAERYGGLAVAARLERDLDNLRAALDWSRAERRSDLVARLAVGMLPIWWTNGHVEEGLRWLGPAPEDETLDPAVRARASVALAIVTMMLGDVAPCVTLADLALEVADPDDVEVRSGALGWRAFFLQWAERDEARRCIAELREISDRPSDQVFAALDEGCVSLWHGRMEDVATAWQRGLDLAVDADEDIGFIELCLRTWLAIVDHILGRDEEGLAVASSLPPSDLAWGGYLGDLARGLALLGLGRRDEAVGAVAEAATKVRRHAVPLAVNDVLLAFAELALHDGDDVRAARLLMGTARRGILFRVPASIALYLHLHERISDRVGADARSALREEVAAGFSPEEAVAAERERLGC